MLLEALASGLPVITAETAGSAELVSRDCGVVLADPNDIPALATALEALIGDEERRVCMGRAARAVAERHSWAQMANAYLRLYEEMAA